jgi:hypothetical protein
MKLLALLRSLPPRTIAVVVASHLMLLAGILWGGMPYLALQMLLAVELAVINLATIPLYPGRGLRKHALDVLKLIAGLLFILFFVVVTYGVARSEGGGADYPLPEALASLAEVEVATLGWAFAYILVHIVISLWQAFASGDPRLTWARSTLSEGGTTLVAMLLMIFVAIFVAVPLLTLFEWLGPTVGVDQLLACLMVAVRCLLAFVMASFSHREMTAMAANPYLS